METIRFIFAILPLLIWLVPFEHRILLQMVEADYPQLVYHYPLILTALTVNLPIFVLSQIVENRFRLYLGGALLILITIFMSIEGMIFYYQSIAIPLESDDFKTTFVTLIIELVLIVTFTGGTLAECHKSKISGILNSKGFVFTVMVGLIELSIITYLWTEYRLDM